MSELREIKFGHEGAFLMLSDHHDHGRSSKGELWSIHAQLVLAHLRAGLSSLDQ